jgi:hypothetical protein
MAVIDWSDLTRDLRWQLLRAGVVVGGRALALHKGLEDRIVGVYSLSEYAPLKQAGFPAK